MLVWIGPFSVDDPRINWRGDRFTEDFIYLDSLDVIFLLIRIGRGDSSLRLPLPFIYCLYPLILHICLSPHFWPWLQQRKSVPKPVVHAMEVQHSITTFLMLAWLTWTGEVVIKLLYLLCCGRRNCRGSLSQILIRKSLKENTHSQVRPTK